ncbi:MAG: flagellar motor protein MotB [Deltaproteobacteria bacterium]|nr:flagellar motor protein MotB [Deltaproteobacteria bacterium]
MWSLVDLLTLLLIFFIFLYTQSSGQLFSRASDSLSLGVPDPVQPIHLATSQKQSPAIASDTIRPNSVLHQNDTNPSWAIEAPVQFIAYQPTPAQPQPETENIQDSGESMENLTQAALNAIHETEDPACSIRWNQNRLVFVLGERPTFPVGKAELLADFEPTLRQIANLLADKKEYDIMISGHTDDTPIATRDFPSNWELSTARAITVARLIIESGVDPRRISVQGYAEYRPLYKNSSSENKEANRRVEIALFKEEKKEPTPEGLH